MDGQRGSGRGTVSSAWLLYEGGWIDVPNSTLQTANDHAAGWMEYNALLLGLDKWVVQSLDRRHSLLGAETQAFVEKVDKQIQLAELCVSGTSVRRGSHDAALEVGDRLVWLHHLEETGQHSVVCTAPALLTFGVGLLFS